ncbi:MAG: hypothetical protein J0H01_32715 [Rhizobiales bacterium]|nr:hypothetical protein [Hyphomicrobiales bacterium]
MAQAHADSRIETKRSSASFEFDDMLALLRGMKPQTDSEAFRLLRHGFPSSLLSVRVAVIGRWHGGAAGDHSR